MKKSTHGGNIYKKAKELGIEESQLLDYSANISPLGLPEEIKKAMMEAIDGTINYPDPECLALREAISIQDQVKIEEISCGNGGADLLYRLAFGLGPKKVLLPVPAFVEYEEAITAAGGEMLYYPMEQDFVVKEDFLSYITKEVDFIILCNPNNPTGILTSRELILKILDKAKSMHSYVMVDECFLEICQDEESFTLKPYLGQYDNLIILKSFTKLYAIPGVRLGYVLSGNQEIVDKINRSGQAWSVSHIAQCAGIAALGMKEYKEAVIKKVEEELKYMKEALRKLPITVYNSSANYIFFRSPGVTDLDQRLESRGIMIRNCSNYANLGRDYWRVAVKSHEENKRLLSAFEEVLKPIKPNLS